MMSRKRLRDMKQSKPGEKAFEVLDTNNDGVVTVEEMMKGTDITKEKVLSLKDKK